MHASALAEINQQRAYHGLPPLTRADVKRALIAQYALVGKGNFSVGEFLLNYRVQEFLPKGTGLYGRGGRDT